MQTNDAAHARGPWIALLLVLVLASLWSSTAAQAKLPYQRCGSSRDGFVFGPNDRWQVNGPFWVAMSARTAADIDRRIPSFEGSHEPTSKVPCNVAESIAAHVAPAWVKWRGNTGVARVSVDGPTGRPYIGRFHCTGTNLSHGRVRETCIHRSDRHAGRIKGRFVIHPASG